MCEPPIDARRAERKHQCAGTGRHHHARRKHTQHAARRQQADAASKKNTLVNGRWFILPCNKAQINATCICFNAASKIAIAAVDLLNKITMAH